MTGKQAWALAPGSRLSWRQLGEHWVVYDTGSGDTHWLDNWAAAALDLLEAQLSSRDGLLAQLAAQFVNDPADPGQQALAAELDGALARLHSLGLVQTPAA